MGVCLPPDHLITTEHCKKDRQKRKSHCLHWLHLTPTDFQMAVVVRATFLIRCRSRVGSKSLWVVNNCILLAVVFFSELGLEASLRMKTPPTLKGDALECSDASKQGCQVIGHIDASIVIQQRILKRKLRLSKWRLACRFPGLQA